MVVSNDELKAFGINTESKIISQIEKRQKKILLILPSYFKITTIIALTGYIISTVIKWQMDDLPDQYIEIFTNAKLNLGSFITILLTLFSDLTLWFYMLWAISFIPFVAIKAHTISQDIEIDLGIKPFRWVQLYSSTFFPMVLFSLAWNSIDTSSYIYDSLHSYQDILIILAMSLVIWGILWLIMELVPLHLIAFHISMFSVLLFTSLFITFGLGFSHISTATLLGIILFLTFTFDKLEEIGMRLSIYDIDPNTAKTIYEAQTRYQEAKAKEDTINIREMEIAAELKDSNQEMRLNELESQSKINQQLADIQKTEIDFNKNVNETTLKVYFQKADHLNKLYQTYSNQFGQKLNSQLPKMIDQFQKDFAELSYEEMTKQMNRIVDEMNDTLNRIPEGMKDLKSQMNRVVREMKDQTKQITQNNENE